MGESEFSMVRLSKALIVMALALFFTLVALGNVTDYGTNLVYVQNVMSMTSILPDSGIGYRAINSSVLQHAAYVLIIVVEVLIAVLLWWGAIRMLQRQGLEARLYNRSKNLAIAGLTLAFLLGQVGFMSIGGEWFGMWMSDQWNGVPSAFRIFITSFIALIYVVMPDN